MDIPLAGEFFTWFNNQDPCPCMSRINRFLISLDFLFLF